MATQNTKDHEMPGLQILISLIQVWTPTSNSDLMTVPDNAMLISEVENIEIEESYRKLIGTASIKLPRGTVIRKTITKDNEKEIAYDKKLTASVVDTGVVEELRSSVSVASVSHFNIGQRIRIYLGYTTDPKVADMSKVNNPNKTIFNDTSVLSDYIQTINNTVRSMNLMFDGYITKISVDTPIELHCENLASRLKQITCPKHTFKSQSTINDFLSDNGKLQLLKDTGIILHPESESNQFDLGRVEINPDLTVADVLTEWAKYGIHAFISEHNNKPAIKIGRSYFSNAKKDSILNATNNPTTPSVIRFDYHVATNGLTLTSTDKKFLGVEAEGLSAEEKFIHLTVLRNPNHDPSNESSAPYRVVNETQLSKKAMKLGARPLSKSADKIDTKLYNTIPYHSRKVPVTKDELLEEAIKYLESYNMNGIDGSLTLFGDLHLHTATTVQLVDSRYPGKNGVYLVDEVHTTFGVGGYRQRITLPYCIKRDKQENNEQS